MASKKIVVLYHNNCPDGFGAAWAAWKKFGNRASYIGVNRGEPLPSGLRGKDVYTLDYCHEEPFFSELKRRASRLIILDHHITRKDAIMTANDHRFSLDHSGAIIAWAYFHPGKRPPRLLQHIEDYDLWRFRIRHTRAVSAILSTYPFDFKVRDRVAKDFENPKKRSEFIKQGYAILKYQERVVERNVSTAAIVEFCGYRVLATNSSILRSEIGGALAEKKGPFGIVWSMRDGKIVVSLRSRKGFDVGSIAARFGGGGHKHAAGFLFPVKNKFPWKNTRK